MVFLSTLVSISSDCDALPAWQLVGINAIAALPTMLTGQWVMTGSASVYTPFLYKYKYLRARLQNRMRRVIVASMNFVLVVMVVILRPALALPANIKAQFCLSRTKNTVSYMITEPILLHSIPRLVLRLSEMD
jgi:hypothetical protein